MKAKSRVHTFLSELRLPPEERKDARQERRAEEAMRSQRDNMAYSETARKAAEAKRRTLHGPVSALLVMMRA